jgi:hypothetical protein
MRNPWGPALVVGAFVRLSRSDSLIEMVMTLWQNKSIGVWLRDGSDVPALAIAMDILGNWIVVRADVSPVVVTQYFSTEVL